MNQAQGVAWVSDIALGVGLAALGTSVVLWTTAKPPPDTRAAVRPIIGSVSGGPVDGSGRGLRRRRRCRVDVAAIRRGLESHTAADRREWQQVRELLKHTVGETMFAIWLEPTELIAVDGDRSLVVAVPPATAAWTTERFGRLMAQCADRVGHELRFASDPEVEALGGAERRVQQPRREVAG